MAKIKYPSVMPSDDKKAIKRGKAVLKQMTPKEFLHEARPLEVGDTDKNIIHTFEDDIEDGDSLGPLKLYEGGKEDGRHRANAAKELGVKKVPVVDYRANRKKKKAAGGAINVPDRLPLNDEDPNATFRRLISWSFAVEPLFRRGRAEGGLIEGQESPAENEEEIVDLALNVLKQYAEAKGIADEERSIIDEAFKVISELPHESQTSIGEDQ
jgi:hypothetical protein